MLGVVVALAVFASLLTSVGLSEEGSSPAAVVGGIVLGAALVALGCWQWSRAARGTVGSRVASRGLKAVSALTPWRALLVGLVLSVNPKSLAVAASAGVAVTRTALPDAEVVLAGAAYLFVAASTVAALVAGQLVVGARFSGALDAVRRWLDAHSQRLAAVVAVVLGLVLVVRGVASV